LSSRDALGLDAVSLLAEIHATLKSIDARLAHLEPAPPPACAALLGEINAAIGSEPFTVAALLDDALDAALVAAVIESTGPLDVSTNKRIGNLLSKAARAHSVAGFRVERIDTAEGVTVWKVSGV
jgi:hypothetical protein